MRRRRPLGQRGASGSWLVQRSPTQLPRPRSLEMSASRRAAQSPVSPPGIVVGGTIHAGDAVALQAQPDNTIAYLNLAGRPVTADLTGQDLGGKTLIAGVYGYTSSAQLTGNLTLDGQGNPNSVFIIKIASGLT